MGNAAIERELTRLVPQLLTTTGDGAIVKASVIPLDPSRRMDMSGHVQFFRFPINAEKLAELNQLAHEHPETNWEHITPDGNVVRVNREGIMGPVQTNDPEPKIIFRFPVVSPDKLQIVKTLPPYWGNVDTVNNGDGGSNNNTQRDTPSTIDPARVVFELGKLNVSGYGHALEAGTPNHVRNINSDLA